MHVCVQDGGRGWQSGTWLPRARQPERVRERETLLDVRRRVSPPPCLFLQEHETEYSMMQMVESSSLRKADPSQFELLKVLGQGSFGKASPYFLIEHTHFLSWSCPIHMD